MGRFMDPILQGTYFASATVKKGNVTYNDQRVMQVVTSKYTSVELSPFTNVGQITYSVYDYNENTPVSGSNIAIVPNNQSYYDFADLLSKAYFIGKTNSSGVVSFPDLPANRQYFCVLFDDNNNQISIWSGDRYFYINKGDNIETRLSVYKY